MPVTRPGRLEGKVALITGAATGIGRASAEAFLAEDARLVLTDLNVEPLEPFAREGALALRQDVAHEAGWRETVDAALARFGRLDALINNAGIALPGNIETATLADWRRTQAVNVEGVFLVCREAVRAMKASGGGSILNLSSAAGIIGDAQSAAYCASKGAVRLLTKSVALHCARGLQDPLQLGASRLHADPLLEGVIAGARNPERVREGLSKAPPLGRLGEAREVAAAVLYLASDESAFTTGAELVIDGGLTLQ
jgi:NAD(P)-dependent dehydrogenase (short-subunit alcohol dehydrogenase family)